MKYNFSKSINKDERTVRSNKKDMSIRKITESMISNRIDWRNRINVANPI